MAHSTSAKNIFTLTKYSRATYKQSDNLQNIQSLKGDCDWQHHTQPTLRLLLELSRSAQGIPEAVRLRVVWTVDKDRPPTNGKSLHQENNIFEDVDLLVVRKHIHPFPTQGLPLKAVFRDNMVGVRYLPPQAKSNNPSEYRRFQITFQYSSDLVTLIDAIQDVCPCKISSVNNPAAGIDTTSSVLSRGSASENLQSPQQPHAPLSAQFQSRIFQTPSGSRIGTGMAQSSDDRQVWPLSSQSSLLCDLPVEFSEPFHQSRQNITVPNLDPRIQNAYRSIQTTAVSRHRSILPALRATQMDLSSSSSPSPFGSQALQRSDMQSRVQQQLIPSVSRSMSSYGSTMGNLGTAGSDPNVSRCGSVAMPTPPTSSQGRGLPSGAQASRIQALDNPSDADIESTNTTKHRLLESLYDACKLEHLSCDELEQLVSAIVREDGFAELLEKIDSLWRLTAVTSM